ncbi:palmitoyltransferase ZDHHC9/14/18 [Nematocida sp. LUAm3]|nr:palmitoyltransferase ZDHHC9/14/18 [Nematocida ausubeli]KAI5173256.1 palmitoyltransferase ZDHHC9/14/18 [Nematocida sp. LUAm3]KAI5176423.1 palmitoyltransferase ZDHHC9/14/18 [Nematocida sp. LUAm2]KAI5179294.1 palmitoyltransferase ZDHHC9/14/18 [Nematocida sp. LUAm1]
MHKRAQMSGRTGGSRIQKILTAFSVQGLVVLALHLFGTVLGIYTSLADSHLLVFYSLLSLMSASIYIRIRVSDPGFLAKRNEEYKRSVYFPHGHYTVLEEGGSIAGRIIKMENDEMEIQTTLEIFCVSCGIFRPYGASHCRECNHCVSHMDHHCPWLDACIGEKNYADFMCFLTLESSRGIFVLLLHILQPAQPLMFPGACLHYFCLVSAALLCAAALSLWLYFAVLLVRGTTARAFCKRRQKKAKILLTSDKRKNFFSDGRKEEQHPSTE